MKKATPDQIRLAVTSISLFWLRGSEAIVEHGENPARFREVASSYVSAQFEPGAALENCHWSKALEAKIIQAAIEDITFRMEEMGQYPKLYAYLIERAKQENNNLEKIENARLGERLRAVLRPTGWKSERSRRENNKCTITRRLICNSKITWTIEEVQSWTSRKRGYAGKPISSSRFRAHHAEVGWIELNAGSLDAAKEEAYRKAVKITKIED